jgi:hypothetical protein
VSRELQKALAEEERKRGLKQADIARTLDVDRATITRQIHGHQNMTLLRVGELASALGRYAVISFPEQGDSLRGSNEGIRVTVSVTTANAIAAPTMLDKKKLPK